MYIRVDQTNITDNYQFYSEDVETKFNNIGDLYRGCMEEYGRCIGSVYVDNKETNKPNRVGWVFLKRAKYDDCVNTFLLETWVSVYESTPKIIKIEKWRSL